MYINEQYHNLPLLAERENIYIGRDGEAYRETEPVLCEHVMDVYINEILTMKLICLSENLTELVLGRLFTEGIIKSTEELEQIYICEFGKRAKVILNKQEDKEKEEYVETTPTCCTGNRILNDYFVNTNEPEPVKPIEWKKEWAFDLADRFAAGTPLHQKTWATHSCFLSRKGKFLFSCEDIGRHNALDKVIGYALRHDIPLTECMVYSSGRIPTDMVIKAITAGIPVLVSKASPTDEAVELSKEYGLTLICAARRDRMKLYSPVENDDF